MTWGSSGSFLPNGATLMLGSPSDDSLVDFQNPINLGSTTQTIQVTSGYGTRSTPSSAARSAAAAG